MSDAEELRLQRKQRQTEGLGLFMVEMPGIAPRTGVQYPVAPSETSHPDSVAGQSQAGLILRHLQSGATLTALDALDLFGCNRLAARVADLKAKGYNVKSRWLVTPLGKRVSEYYLTSTND